MYTAVAIYVYCSALYIGTSAAKSTCRTEARHCTCQLFDRSVFRSPECIQKMDSCVRVVSSSNAFMPMMELPLAFSLGLHTVTE